MATVTVTPGYSWSSGEIVTPAKMNLAAAPTVTVTDTIPNNSVTTVKILDGAVTNAKLATGLDASKLTTGTLPIARIADSAVTGSKLADGMTVQTVYSQTTSIQTIDQAIPADNTKPQNSEGEEVFAAAITPTSSTNKILVEAMIQGTSNPTAAGTIILALFKNNDASAVAASFSSHTASYANQISLTYQDSPATTSEVTYKLRAGFVSGGTGLYMNGNNSGQSVLDGTLTSWIKLTEIKAS
jgi:hypothetical protein